ncbi:MAG: hypothetical protein AAF559_00130 [Pseudomonadota bacterium]
MSEPLTVSRGLIHEAADALSGFSREVEELGAGLCCDPDIAERYLDLLQGLDRIAQSLDQLAGVLRAPHPDEAIDALRMGDLQNRLRVARHA